VTGPHDVRPHEVPILRIRLKKGRDGPHTLACTRADGSVTVQHNRQDFFPPHDLSHYAVESVLGYMKGFYGLVADGWDLSDFAAPWPRGRLPADLDPAELIVGQLDLERGTGVKLTAADLNAHVVHWLELNAPGSPAPRPVTEPQLTAIREMQARLHTEWRNLPPGEAMEVVFPAVRAS